MKKRMEDECAVDLDLEIIAYFVKLSLKKETDFKILIQNALRYIIEQRMEPKVVWKKIKNKN